MAKRGGFGHEKPIEGDSESWITPRWVIDAFGVGYFDLDPCACATQPWSCARKAYTVEQDGLAQPWFPANTENTVGANIWLNPPYGKKTAIWVSRLAEHGTGIGLIFARVETRLWQEVIFPTADAYLFPKRRISFCDPDGKEHVNAQGQKSSSGAPSAFIAWGGHNRAKLLELASGTIEGAFFERAICSSQIPLIRNGQLI